MVKTPHRQLIFIVFLLAVLSACSVTNYVVAAYDDVTINATSDVNPDSENRPSPIQVKIYELSSRTTFDNLDFDKLFNQGKTFLSDELISEAVYMLQPSETIEHEVALNDNAAFVAVIAAYRDIDGARWKHIYAVNPNGYYNHEVTLTQNAIAEGKQSGGSVETEDVEKSADTAEKGHSTYKRFGKK